MKKLHIHIGVSDIEKSTGFYTQLFNAEPCKHKEDYVKWSLDNPPLNFAISKHGKPGLDHLGIEVENSSELKEMYLQADAIDTIRDEEGETICCYARSEKSWLSDPQGIKWELFHTLNDEETYRGHHATPCCIEQPGQPSCC